MKISNLPATENIELSYGTEGFFELSSLANYFSSFIGKIINVFNAKTLIPIPFLTTELTYACRAISKHPQSALEHFTVITPEYVDGEIVPYLKVLHDVVIELSSIEARLLKPIEQWAGNMLTDPTYGEKIWINLPIADKKIELYTAQLHEYFNESVGDGTAAKPFVQVYHNVAGLEEAATLIKTLTDISIKLLDGKLSEKSDSVAELVNRLTSHTEVANNIQTLPAEKMKPIVDLTIQAAKELELLAIVMFQIKTASFAHSETINKINTQLT